MMRESELVADPLNRLIQAEAGFDADHEEVERVRQPETNPVLAALGQPAERHRREQVPERAEGQRHQQIRPRQQRRHQQEEQRDRAGQPNTEKERKRLGAAIPGRHELLLQLAHFGRRLRGGGADFPERFGYGSAVAPFADDGPFLLAAADQFAETALDRGLAAARQRHRARGDDQGCKEKRKERKQQDHGYTSILMT
jgi:hypothetical protein